MTSNAATDRPTALPLIPDAIPEELKERNQWVVWRYVFRDGKWTKPPLRAVDGTFAKSTDPSTWCSFEQTMRSYRLAKWDGIGFVLSPDDPFIAIDLDHCVVDGTLQPWTDEQRSHKRWHAAVPSPADICNCGSYAETSPSGTGCRVIARGEISKATKHGAFEIYSSARYVTFTGHQISERGAIIEIDAESLRLKFDKPQAQPAPKPQTDGNGDVAEHEILKKLFASKIGDRARRLYGGDWDDCPSQSEADQSLCNMLAFYAGPNGHAIIDRLFRESGLYRDKWDREDYRTATIAKAIDDRTEFYKWANKGRTKAKTKPSNEQGFIKTLADLICKENNFAQDAGGKLYRYADGVYKSKGDQFVKRQVTSLGVGMDCSKAWAPKLANDVVEFIRVDSPELWERPPFDTINVKNGLLRVDDFTLAPHSPVHLSPVQLPVKYDPEATCPVIETFVKEVFTADAHSLAWEVPAWLMRPDTSIQKAVLLTGEGSNGKSTWLTLLSTFLGKQNTAAVSLHKLEANQFAAARLIGKLANICPDLPSSHLESTSTFKAIVGNDTLNTEYKHKDSFEFTPFCRLVFSANHPPRSQDASHAFFRRWLVIPFDRTIEPAEAIPRDVLDARLSAPAELSGLLNKALDALPRLKSQRGFSEPTSVKQAWQEFHATTDPLAVWLDRFTVDHPDAIVPKQTLRSAYGADCERRGRPSPTAKAFGSSLYNLRSDVEEAQRTVNGKVQWCYVGIGMSHPESDGSQDSRDSRDSSLFDCESRNHDVKQSEKAAETQSRAKAVNPVNLVNDDPCKNGGPHTWLDSAESDGRTRRYCTICCKFGGFVRADGVVVQTLDELENA